jgi:enamine deaminase RidA (YjgF/YER057c/UK114 family)
MRIVDPPQLVRPIGFSHGVSVAGPGTTLFLAGQCGHDADGAIGSPGDLVAQFDQSLANLAAVLRAAGMEFGDVASFTIYVLDRDDYLARRKELGAVYRRHLGSHYPAMVLVEVRALFDPLALIEITGIAAKAARARAAGEPARRKRVARSVRAPKRKKRGPR